MIQTIPSCVHLIYAIIFLILIILFTIRSIRTKNNVPYFILSYICFLLIGFLKVFGEIFFPTLLQTDLFTPIEMIILGWGTLYLFLFLRSLQVSKIYDGQFLIFFTIFIIQQVSLLFVILTKTGPVFVHHQSWLIADISYSALGIFTSGFIGFKHYFEHYKIFKLKISLFLIHGYILNILGYLSLLFCDIEWFISNNFPQYAISNSIITIISEIGNLLPIGGMILILIVYISNISYFYINPHDLFIFIILDQNGDKIFSSQYISQKGKAFYPQDMTNLLNSLNSIFNTIFHSPTPVRMVVSKNMEMISKSGTHISAIILSNSVTKILEVALARFVHHFEKTMIPINKSANSENSFTEQTVGLLVDQFPFLTKIIHSQ